MLGSVQDAEDVLQETLLRAWRGAAGLRDPAAARVWLYRIATNVCLTELERRRTGRCPRLRAGGRAGHAARRAGHRDDLAGALPRRGDRPAGRPRAPEASYEQHEAVELAFVAALQHLAASQRAVLLLRDVLGSAPRRRR